MAFPKIRHDVLIWLAAGSLGLNLSADQLNWPALDKNLPDPENPLDRKTMLSRFHRQAGEAYNDKRVLTEMALQTDYPIMAACSELRLAQLDPDLAYRVSWVYFWKSGHVASLANWPFFECITNAVRPDLFRSAFSAVAFFPPKQYAATMFIQLASVNNLLEWLKSPESRNSSLSVEAPVVARLMEAQNQLGADELSVVRARLVAMSKCAGPPLAVYLEYSEVETAQLVPLVKVVLEDGSVDPFLKGRVIRTKAKSLKGTLDVSSLKLTEKEKASYKRSIEYYSK